MKATVLVDNIPYENLEGEWGLSIYIEHNGHKLLLDSGATELFAANAETMGIDLSKVEAAFLSHAHYDHSGGMPAFFEKNRTAQFYLQSRACENCYKYDEDGNRVYIGIPEGTMQTYHGRFRAVDGDSMVLDGVELLAHHTPDLAKQGKREGMFQLRNGKFEFDDFSHEQSLILHTTEGLVIFNSCSHGGAANVIREVQNAHPGEKIAAMIGGFHLYNKTEEEIAALGNQLKELGITAVYTGHCTGIPAYEQLEHILGSSLHHLQTGLVIEIGG